MDFDLERAIEVLSRTPKILEVWLGDLPEFWVLSSHDAEDWGPYDVLGHFVHGERTDWIARARIILAGNGVQEFEPFDRFAQFEASQGKSLAELLRIFAELRAENLATLKGFELQLADYELKGRHPELGVVTLEQLLATWVVHDLNHLGQIAQVMAKRYREAVGPWLAYLDILER